MRCMIQLVKHSKGGKFSIETEHSTEMTAKEKESEEVLRTQG